VDTTRWETRTPDIVADVWLYSTDEGGRASPMSLGYGCSCFAANDFAAGGWDARLQLGDAVFAPGTNRRVGFVFLSGREAAEVMWEAGRFFLWEGRFIGEATVVSTGSWPVSPDM